MSSQKVCPHCQRSFYPLRTNQRFCGKACQERTWAKSQIRETRTFDCPQCSTEVTTSDIRKKYCTQTCGWRAANSRRKRLTFSRKKCIGCGEEFRPKHYNTVYCSPKCRNKVSYKKNRQYFSLRHWKYRKQNKWEGNWYAALQRDKFTCQLCGIRSWPSQWNSSKKKRLMVHHRDGTGETDDKNHDLNNLQTLCNPCHKQFHMIHLLYIDGHYFVSGNVFGQLGINEIKTMPSQHS